MMFPTKFYSFGGAGGGDVWALEPIDGRWRLSYYDERGSRDQDTFYETENDGCLAMLAKLSDMVRSNEHRDIDVD